jgi:hypothetical protein
MLPSAFSARRIQSGDDRSAGKSARGPSGLEPVVRRHDQETLMYPEFLVRPDQFSRYRY